MGVVPKVFGMAAFGVAALLASQAQAVNVGFSFEGERFTSGTVYGTLYDLSANGVSTPDRISVVGDTPDYLQQMGIYAGGAEFDLSQITGGLDLVDGAVVGGELSARNGGALLMLAGDGSQAEYRQNGYEFVFYQQDQITEGGSGPTFFDYASAAPEPGAWALMLAGVAMVGSALRLRRRPGAVRTAVHA